MRAKRKLLPGQPGTQKLLAQYGDDLVCVRYRYDPDAKKRIKTVELIVDEAPWQKNPRRIPPNKIVGIRVNYSETELRRLVKAAGGKWNPRKQLWLLPYREVKELNLTGRIREGGPPTSHSGK